MAKTTIYFVTDLHGSSVCFRKFINAAPIYGANVLVLGAKVLSPELAEQITAKWLATSFRGERHQKRLDQIAALERGESLL